MNAEQHKDISNMQRTRLLHGEGTCEVGLYRLKDLRHKRAAACLQVATQTLFQMTMQLLQRVNISVLNHLLNFQIVSVESTKILVLLLVRAANFRHTFHFISYN